MNTIGIDIGGTNVKFGLVDGRGRVLVKKVISTKEHSEKGFLIEKLVEGIVSLKGRRSVLGVGIGAPGAVDSRRGIVHYLVNISGWRDVPLKSILEKRIGLSVFVDNDVNLMALGEYRYGAGRGVKDMICITLGTGVGGGLILNGELYRGANLSGGEIGHMPLNEKGPACPCGAYGCMELYVGNSYIIKDVVKKIKRGAKTRVIKMAGGDFRNITPALLHKAALLGDEFAIGVWADVGKHLGTTLAGVVNLLNPERIVIGGGVANAGRFVLEPVRRTIKERAMPMQRRAVKVVRAKLGENAGIIGAAEFVRGEIKGRKILD